MRAFLMNWFGAFAVVTPLLYAMQPLLADWPIWAKAFVLSGLMVLAMQRAILPLIGRLGDRSGP
ncbi:MAG: hypothetical protein AAF732_08220 [Pseudomonadota bacterium]